MKKILWALIPLIAIPLALTGCMGDVVDVTVVVKNSTDYELKWIVFNIPQSSGTYSPMNNIITADDGSLEPGGEREVVISFVDTDFGNSGGALIGLEDDGSSDSLYDAKGAVVLERETNRFKITYDGETFVISAYDDTDDSNIPASETTKPDALPAPEDEISLTRFADFAKEIRTKETALLPIGHGAALPSLAAFYLQEETKGGNPGYLYIGEGEIGQRA